MNLKTKKFNAVYENTVRNIGFMGNPETSLTSLGINQDSAATQNMFTPNEYRISENEEEKRDKEIRIALKKIKEILDNITL